MGSNESQPYSHSNQPVSTSARSLSPLASGRAGWASRSFSSFRDRYRSIDEVRVGLRESGLESSNLLVAIDFTKSNEWTGANSFGGRCLHSLGSTFNPYQQAVDIIGRTLSQLDDDQYIPCYGFGDVSTGDKHVFSFYPADEPCAGLSNVLTRYRELVPHVKLAGPTSFAPAIHQAINVVQGNSGKFHILLLIADGQVTRSVDMEAGELSPQEESTIQAIVAASHYPLSIIMVGVGDGPWDMMKDFDDNLPQRAFDNFQFVNLTQLMSQRNGTREQQEAAFALEALMEVPDQYKAMQRLGLLSGHHQPEPQMLQEPVRVLPPPFFQPLPSAPPSAPAPPPINSMFICPITQEVMRDPVMAADGHTYEKADIENWLRSHNNSPMTNQQLPNKTLIPNHSLRSAIMEARQRGQI